MFAKKNPVLPTQAEALPGRAEEMTVPERHFVSGKPLRPPFPEGLRQAVFGLGCFWGAERRFWETEGVFTTAVGYAGGITPNPDYREVCSGLTGHAEVVLVVFDPGQVAYEQLLREVWGRGYENSREYVRVYVGRLRGKLENPDGPSLILTEPRAGYRLVPPGD